MGKVIFDMSMSLDGFVAAADRTAEEPMGRGGERLHEWAFNNDDRDREILAGGVAGIGAIICGRRTYDDSIPWWGADGPTGPARLPLFVVTHDVPDNVPEGSVYTFVTDGIESALAQARAAAGDKDVAISGASIGQQYIAAGLVDEIGVHLVPVLFGCGVRMFESLGGEHVHLETIEAVKTDAAIHLRFRVVR